MTLSQPRRAAGTTAAALLALALVAGCADEAPTNDEQTSATEDVTAGPAPSEEDTTTATGDDDVAATSSPDTATATSGDQEESTADAAATTQEPTTAEPTTLASGDGGFEVDLPAGWEDAVDLVDPGELAADEDPGIVLAVKDTQQADDFYTNVVITREEYISNLTSAVEQTAEELAGEDGEYELLEPAEVDGNRAPGYVLTREVDGTAVRQTQRWVSHDGTLYVVTLSAVEGQDEEAGALLDDLLASWSWTD
ncbi:MAG TPA: hypothetical protein VLO09_07560 [Ornithinimicrobium sp.]|nr:hypothetical protein [Ornithinimicrobium sp.]